MIFQITKVTLTKFQIDQAAFVKEHRFLKKALTEEET